jgi:hypothetical protein
MTMDETTKTAKKVGAELEKNLEQLRALRDEVRVRAHLAKMDVKDRWRELEPRVAAVVEQAAKSASEASHTAVNEAIQALQKLRNSLP